MSNNARFGVDVPNFGDYFHPATLVELACEAEKAGWDGFFIWDHISSSTEWKVPVGDTQVPIAYAPYADPWVALAAIALKTKRIRIGALVTPLARRRPWKLARETVSIDHLSHGRLIVGVGLGGTLEEFETFGEISTPQVRASKLDEGLDILTGLWTGKPFSYSGKHYQLKETTFSPPPVQTPRIPIWGACFWPNKKPLRRAARYDGVFPGTADWTKKLTPNDIREIIAYIRKHRTSQQPFDVALGGATPADPEEGAKIVQPFLEAGVTWWLEELSGWRGPIEAMKKRIKQGPPNVK